MLSQDVRIHILCLDIVQNAIDSNVFIDYMKQNYKKEISFLNAMDYSEPVGRAKPDLKKEKSIKHDSVSIIVRGIKQKIDSEVIKVADAKKKAFAQYEKQRAAAGKGKGRNFEEMSKYNLPFEGTIDVLYILSTFPYLPNQLAALSEADFPVSFLCIVPKGGAQRVPYLKRTSERSSRLATKKQGIAGMERDSALHPNVFPPPRWAALRPTASATIAFCDMEAGDDAESTFKRLEQEMIRVNYGREEYIQKFAGKSFRHLPLAHGNIALGPFNEYVNQKADRLNGLFYTLRLTAPVSPPPTAEAQLTRVFQTGREILQRTVNFVSDKELPDPWFPSSETRALSSLLYRCTHWQLTPANAASCRATFQFLQSASNSHAFAGQRFDTLTATVNKKYQLGLPMSFFDWLKWDVCTEYESVADVLIEAVHHAGIVETLLDDDTGLLWVLTLPPIPRMMGHFFVERFVPQTINGFTDFLKFLYDKPAETEKKTRNFPSPAQVLREDLSPEVLMPPLQERMSQAPTLYGLSLNVSTSASFSSPYFFASELKVTIQRDLVSGKLQFGYFATFKSLLEISGTGGSVMLFLIEGIRLLIEFEPFAVTILFNDQSLLYDRSFLMMRSRSQSLIMISTDKSFVMPNSTLSPDGTVGRLQDGVWSYVKPDSSLWRRVGPSLEQVPTKHGKLEDLATGTTTMIRPDDVSLAIRYDGTRVFHFNEHVSVEQGPRSLYDISDFPITYQTDSAFSITLDRFEITFKGPDVSVTCDEYGIQASAEKVRLIHSDADMALSKDRCEFKTGDQVLVADASGVEKMVQIGMEIPAKKKIEVFETSWGQGIAIKDTMAEPQQLELHRKFLPRFFLVRDGTNGCEYLRGDVIDMEGVTVQNGFFTGPKGEKVSLVSFHYENKVPLICVQNEPLAKAARSALLKNLHVPKQKKAKKTGEPEDDENEIAEAESARATYFLESKQFAAMLLGRLDSHHLMYLQKITPPPPPPPELIRIPPPTPDPRLMLMQAYKRTLGMTADKSTNYWVSGEGDFAVPVAETRVGQKALSPRVALFDPPRCFRPERKQLFPMIPVSRRPNPVIRPVLRSAATAKSRQATVRADRDTINFGTVTERSHSTASMIITNLGAKPLHFSVTQPKVPCVKVLTVPGVVYPGLKMTVKVALMAPPVGSITTSFMLMTKEVSGPEAKKSIPIIAEVTTAQA
jgi:hypothetical protein